jgi:hypothetical protein
LPRTAGGLSIQTLGVAMCRGKIAGPVLVVNRQRLHGALLERGRGAVPARVVENALPGFRRIYMTTGSIEQRSHRPQCLQPHFSLAALAA